jgi:hypothetical protein
VKSGPPRTFCSVAHQRKAASDRQVEKRRTQTERKCGRCKATLPVTEFAGPTSPYCKPCFAEYSRNNRKGAWYTDPDRSRRDSLARYGLTLAGFDALLATQGGVCKVCGTGKPGGVGGPRGWHVDHDHACCNTRKRSCGKCVRGILCSGCNVGIGCLHEDPVIIRAALDYLAAYQARRGAVDHVNSMPEIGAATTT